MKELLEYQKKITDLEYTINLLNWELKLNCPIKATDDIINLISIYENKLFELKTNEKYGKLLKNVINNEIDNISEEEIRYIKNQYRYYLEYKRIPSDFYIKYTELISKSTLVWKEAKENNDYEMLKPYLKNVIEYTKKYYNYINPHSNNIYDVMLNQYEIGLTSETIDKLFDELKQSLIPLIKKVSTNNYIEYKKEYTNDELMNCAKYLLSYIGFDLSCGKLDIFPHGFTDKLGPNDVRIAFKNNNLPSDFVSTIIHEGGHGLFEQNVKQNLSKYENHCVDNLYALHESQSRFYENILGRNKNFWIPIYNDIKSKLHLDLTIDEFVNLLNQVKPSLIRTEADELTYCLHIIIRYEIEKMIFNDEININDLPKIWNEKMEEYLGIIPKNDIDGIMQDIHWSEGNFGYFPSYLLGTIYDGMFLEQIESYLGPIDDILASGNIKKITNYLIDNIYKNGGAYTSRELIKKLCKKDISTKPIINYFNKKYKK